MNYTLENDKIKLTVAEHGAEIKSLIRKADGKELMWQADAAYWGRTAPVLFPLVGNYYQKKSVYKGQTYEMGQHGFARDMDFMLGRQTENELVFLLKDNEESRKKYPFSFLLVSTYRLENDTVNVEWKVENPNEETMYFSIGGHPAFNCDLDTYTLRFEKDNQPNSKITANIIADDGSGCLGDEQKQFVLSNGVLGMSDELFSRDALIIEDRQSDKVTLIDDKGQDVIAVKFDAPLFGVWSPVGKHAPFVCIEPWYGRCDRVGFNQKLEEREYGNTLSITDIFQVSFDIQVF
ncbi:MAG: aldose 1-epimerase family protein [Pseudobutyrivibrio ruminis]|uniref:aldose 1-epimerase family protein n=1 Tax=Pseudobutyrivibrio ruminis TaxID=46206 RepID=UPI0026F300E3|nr:aldose 1-epimerase family protein [Pseudobutyrivibrio ruminis]MBE5913462.1 aldose 1-epimerase family protein [Pseudobutyrivibrio ruminis]